VNQNTSPQQDEPAVKQTSPDMESRFAKISWGVTILLVVSMVAALIWYPSPAHSSAPVEAGSTPQPTATLPAAVNVSLPEYSVQTVMDGVARLADGHTTAPTRPRDKVIEYTVQKGDSVFGIAQSYNIKPESILWANYDTLKDDPDMISPGLVLKIPPTDGVLYKWQDGDTLQGVANLFKAKLDDVLGFFGNRLDLTNPVVKPGEYLMVVGGSREFKQWLIPTIPRGPAGVLKTLLGTGACDTSTSAGYGGSGAFIWPADNHYLSGNDYYSAHLGLDIAAGEGMSIYAADSGLVVYAGWAYGGYGNMVMIDHNNGYQTLYAHLSAIFVQCGQGVGQGRHIGNAGMTGGTSTGPHLHFEVRYLGGWVNPWYVLP
jgi:murein DD-endopeptidase MepM/ murein hydrolase activator NlpD